MRDRHFHGPVRRARREALSPTSVSQVRAVPRADSSGPGRAQALDFVSRRQRTQVMMENRKAGSSRNTLREMGVFFALLLPTLLIYQQGFGYGFVGLDDTGQVPQDPEHYGLSLAKLRELFSSTTISMYQPLTSLALALIVAVFGYESATAFHVFSFLVHFANVWLVYLLGRELLGAWLKALLLALLFATHPLMVESVHWVSATSTVLFSFFFLSALVSYVRYVVTQRRGWYLLSLCSFTIGAFAKVQIVPFIGVLLLVDYLFKRRLLSIPLALEKVPFVVVAVLFLGVAIHFRGGQSGFPGYDYAPVLLVPNQLLWYLQKLVVPTDLGVVYDWPQAASGFSFYAAYVSLVAIGAVVFRLRENRLLVFGVLFYLCNLLLHTAAFTQFLGPYADRYAYLSTLGIWLALFGLVAERHFRYLAFALVAAIGVYSVLAFRQLRTWQSSVAMWTHNIQHQAASFSYGMRGAEYYKGGQLALAKADFERVASEPDSRFEPDKLVYLYTALGSLETAADPKKALEYFRSAVAVDGRASAYDNLAAAYLKLGEDENAEASLRRAIAQEPGRLSSREQLVSLYFDREQFQEMLPLFLEMLALGKDPVAVHKMRAYAYLQLDMPEEAGHDVRMATLLLSQRGQDPLQDPQLVELQRLTAR